MTMLCENIVKHGFLGFDCRVDILKFHLSEKLYIAMVWSGENLSRSDKRNNNSV
jgi:hypothetical protein